VTSASWPEKLGVIPASGLMGLGEGGLPELHLQRAATAERIEKGRASLS
jgi:hypothetical protein